MSNSPAICFAQKLPHIHEAVFSRFLPLVVTLKTSAVALRRIFAPNAELKRLLVS